MPEEDQDKYAEQIARPEDSQYYEVWHESNHADVPMHERKDGAPSPIPDHDRQVSS